MVLMEQEIGGNMPTYTSSDIARMERQLEALYEELEATPHRAQQIQKEIDNLKYHLEIAKKNLR